MWSSIVASIAKPALKNWRKRYRAQGKHDNTDPYEAALEFAEIENRRRFLAKLDLARVSPDDARDLIAELELHLVHIDEPHGHRPWDGCDCDCE
jgi:hypothetical protein